MTSPRQNSTPPKHTYKRRRSQSPYKPNKGYRRPGNGAQHRSRSFGTAQLRRCRCRNQKPTDLAGLAFLSAQQSLQPANAVISVEWTLACRDIGTDAERELAQGCPVFCEQHPSGTIGRVSCGFRFAHALLRSQLAFADAFHSQSPLAATTST